MSNSHENIVNINVNIHEEIPSPKNRPILRLLRQLHLFHSLFLFSLLLVAFRFGMKGGGIRWRWGGSHGKWRKGGGRGGGKYSIKWRKGGGRGGGKYSMKWRKGGGRGRGKGGGGKAGGGGGHSSTSWGGGKAGGGGQSSTWKSSSSSSSSWGSGGVRKWAKRHNITETKTMGQHNGTSVTRWLKIK